MSRPTLLPLLAVAALLALAAAGVLLVTGLAAPQLAAHMAFALLVLPLYIPALIFGAGAVEAHIAGLGAGGHLSLLAAMLALAVFFAPWATTAALRIALE